MSGHALDFLKDYSGGGGGGLQEESTHAVPKHTAGNESDLNPANGRKVAKRKKRVEVTKKELAKKQIQERRRAERQVIEDKCNCHLSCMQKIPPEQRKTINVSYWAMDPVEQKRFVKNHTVPGPVKRRRIPVDPLGGVAEVKKAFSYSFYLPDGRGELQMTCCTFFLNTLGFRKGCGNHIYRAHMRETFDDHRGKYERDHSLRDAVWDDILSYAPRTYHKGSKFSATALYLPNQLNAKMMHADFKVRREAIGEKPGSASFYCAVMREMDLHFVEMDDFQLPERRPLPVPKRSSSPLPQPPPMEEIVSAAPMVEEARPDENKQLAVLESPSTYTCYEQSLPMQSYQEHAPPQNAPHPYQPYPEEQKPPVPHYTEAPHYPSSASFQPVIVKEEPYYGMAVESITIPNESTYVDDDDDDNYSDSYSTTMIVEPDYSEASYHEPSPRCETTMLPSNNVYKVEPPTTEHLLVTDVKPEQSCLPSVEPPLPGSSSSQQPPPPKKRVRKRSNKPPPPPSNETSQQLPEGYPQVKRTKKFIAKVRILAKRKQSHPVLKLDCNCHHGCKDKISAQQQDAINDRYWSMGFCDQRMFMLEHTERHSVKRRRSKLESENIRKGYTYSYRLTDSRGLYQEVCCQFFLNTIGFGAGSGNVIYRAHKVELSQAISDKRGKFTRDTTLRDLIDDDIMSYFSAELQEAGGPFDLSATEWSPKRMFNQYVARQAALGNNSPGSFGFYWRRAKENKILFAPKPEPKAGGGGKKRSRSSNSAAQQKQQATMSFTIGYNNMPQ